MNPLETLLTALRDHGFEAKPAGKGYACCCPAHDDHNPSLGIDVGDDGRVLILCRANCETPDVLAAIGLSLRDLMPDTGTGIMRTGSSRRADMPAAAFPTDAEAVAQLERKHGPRTHVWTYADPNGTPVGLVVRWDTPDGKIVRPVSLNGAGWVLEGMLAPRPLYGLPRIMNSPTGSRIYVTEGEKAADAALALGLTATTSAHGSKSAAKANWSPLAGREVVILPDHDEAGERYAEDVGRLARAAGARSVRVVRLAERWTELPAGGDIADVLDLSGGDMEEVIRAIGELVTATEPEVADLPATPARFTPFPVDALPEPIRTYVIEGARAIGCDPSYIALPMLSALASAIGNTHRIQLKRSWAEPAIIWTVIVGESGTAKSPALELALRPVRKRQQRAMKEHADATKAWEVDHARWEVDMAAWKREATTGPSVDPPPEPQRPVCHRTWTDDATTEALVVRLQENPRGLLMVRDELSGWFNFDRYAGGKGGGDAAKWLEVFGGRALIVDRKTSATEYVPHASVSIAGGIQPEVLARVLGQQHRDNGLAARLLFAMPPRTPKRWTDDDVAEHIEASVDAVFDRLYALQLAVDHDGDPEPRLVALTAEAKQAWVRFVNQHGAEQAERIGDEAAAWSKLEGYAARIALVFHLTQVAASDPTIVDPQVVDLASVEAGVELVRWFAGEAERVYAGLEADDADREQARLIEWIEGRGGAVTVRELTKGLRDYRGKPGRAREAFDALATAGHGEWDQNRPPISGGRPAERFRLHMHVPVPESPPHDGPTRGFGDGDGGDTLNNTNGGNP